MQYASPMVALRGGADGRLPGFVAQLRPGLVRVAPTWTTFAETVSGLAAMLVGGRALSRNAEATAVQAVLAREEEASTALLDIGVGVPHARLPGIKKAIVALAMSPRGLYEPVPTVPITIAALVLSPPTKATDHLRLVADISTLLRSPALRSAVLEAVTPDAVLAALREHARVLPER